VALFRESLQETIAVAISSPVIVTMGDSAATQSMTVMVRGHRAERSHVAAEPHGAAQGERGRRMNGIVLGRSPPCRRVCSEHSARLGHRLAMLLNSLLACLAGTLVPVVLKRMGVDPPSHPTRSS